MPIMIHYADCKINLGLYILAKRRDGYHDISTVMVPVSRLYDLVEAVPSDNGTVRFESGGIVVDCPNEQNLCVRAFNLMQKRYGVGGIRIFLYKKVPFGAGLGGGSSDAVAVIKLIDRIYGLSLSENELTECAAMLGSDTPFFVYDRPMLCEGRGEIMIPCPVDLSGYWLTILKPPFGVGTADAYRGVVPCQGRPPLADILKERVENWRGLLVNDFEKTVFREIPYLAELKAFLYEAGALYASLSGSGSALYALSKERPDMSACPGSVFIHQQLCE